mgnify:FL=1|tara:strand:- start:359 stop:1303 length:945 start_codon:yes stop_codon:yes gene_type:complete
MNIVIVGQGAIGLLFYHFISQTINSNKDSADSVSLRPSYPITNKHEPYYFTDINGLTNILTLNYANDSKIKSADIILLAVKSYQVKQALMSLTPLISLKTVIVLCHNGMGTFEQLPEELTKQRLIIAMLTTHGCLKNAPLNITHTGLGQVDFGIIDSHLFQQPSSLMKRDEAIISKLEQVLTPASFHHDIIEKQWLKLSINCVINPLTAIYDVDNGSINNEKYKVIVSAALAEIVLVAKTQGIVLELSMLISMVHKVAQSTSENSSSMRCDLIGNKPTEIDYINGYIHRLGQINNIKTPTNSDLWQQISQRKLT